MGKKLVVLAHGIGAAEREFYKAWEAILRKNHKNCEFDVAGLWWEDVLDKVREKYPIVSKRFAAILNHFDLGTVKKLVDKEAYCLIEDYAMDVLVYAGLPDMSQYIAARCTEKLAGLCARRKKDTILIGHSLGAAMLPHVVWQEDHGSGSIAYSSMVLLASPLGIRSPVPWLMDDLLSILGKINGGDRITTLKRFAGTWALVGDGRLHFLMNRNDLVCWDVKFKVGVQERDLIPVQQGFNFEELRSLEEAHPGSTDTFESGRNVVADIVNNHDAVTYLESDAFKTVFDRLLSL